MTLAAEYTKINPYESKCEVRSGKLYAPFKCNRVPEDYLKLIVAKYPKLCQYVFWETFLKWMKGTQNSVPIWHRKNATKHYRNDPLAIKLQGIIQRELNYERTTFISGHIVIRFGRLYRRMMGYNWNIHDPFGPNRATVFYKNGIEIDRIKDR